MSSTRTKDKCSPQEWAEVKKKAKADLDSSSDMVFRTATDLLNL